MPGLLAQLRPDAPADELVATAALVRARVMSEERLSAAIDHFGSAVEVARLSDADRLAPQMFEITGSITDADGADAQGDVSQWRQQALGVRTPLSLDYPGNLLTIFNKLSLLFETRVSASCTVMSERRPAARGVARSA